MCEDLKALNLAILEAQCANAWVLEAILRKLAQEFRHE